MIERIQDITGGVKVSSPAKLNLYLEVLSKRPDGYHNIRTIFERISLADEIIIRNSVDSRIVIKTASRDIPGNETNLAYKAAALLKNSLKIAKGVVIRIKKRIPVGAGLGGGSSNAASTLLGLNRLWNLKLGLKQLLKYASKLGSDVAFFIYDCPFALGQGRGERIRPLKNIKKKFWHVLAVPDFKVSTPEIYQEFDTQINTDKKTQINTDLRIDNGADLDKVPIKRVLFNRLEEVTFKKYPQVKKLKENLMAQGINNVLMSGSGGAVFGVVNSRKEGLGLARIFKPFRGLEVFVVKTL